MDPWESPWNDEPIASSQPISLPLAASSSPRPLAHHLDSNSDPWASSEHPNASNLPSSDTILPPSDTKLPSSDSIDGSPWLNSSVSDSLGPAIGIQTFPPASPDRSTQHLDPWSVAFSDPDGQPPSSLALSNNSPAQALSNSPSHTPSIEQQDGDVWANEAKQRNQRATQLSSDQVDQLKVASRKIILAASPIEQASFRVCSVAEDGWQTLFGNQGEKQELYKALTECPTTILTDSGSLHTNIFHISPVTNQRIHEAIRKTDGKGPKLVGPETSHQSRNKPRIQPKPDWDPSLANRSNPFLSTLDSSLSKSTLQVTNNGTSGPGWIQSTANKDAKASSGSGFLVNLFKSRQTNQLSSQAGKNPAGSSSRNSLDQASQAPSFSSISHNSNPPVAALEPYRDDQQPRYTGDPSGPDLLSLDISTPEAPISKSTKQQSSFYSRWKSTNLFKPRGVPFQDMNQQDFACLQDQPSPQPDGKNDTSYGFDDSFEAMESTSLSQTYRSSSYTLTSKDPKSMTLDPFDDLLDDNRSHGGLSTENSKRGESLNKPEPLWNLDKPKGTSNSSSPLLSSTASATILSTNPLPTSAAPIPKSTAHQQSQTLLSPPLNRFSLPPPPRVAPQLAKPSDLWQDNVADSLIGDLIGNPIAHKQPPVTSPAPTIQPVKTSNVNQGLTVDDLLFFDNL